MLSILSSFFKLKNKKEQKLFKAFERIIGASPGNFDLYILAVKHVSAGEVNRFGIRESYERLEFLGDAVLGLVVGEFLFKKYPLKDEGFLTEIRSRIVNGESLARLAKKIGLDKLVEVHGIKKGSGSHSVYGDAMEALLGAIFLDKGFSFCRKFILKKILNRYFDIDEVVSNNDNYKSILIEFAQKENKKIHFVIVGEQGAQNHKSFVAEARMDDEAIGQGQGLSKKKAEQNAAFNACEQLGLLR